MSPMQATHGHSEACCNIPPVVATGYQAKGSFEEIDGRKTYVTGPTDATKAIIVQYDIFGYFDQTIQGVDIIAYSEKQKYRVYMPDWFDGEPCPISIFPPSTDEQRKQLSDFFATNDPREVSKRVPKFVDAIKSTNSNISSFGIMGYCWGGKVSILVTSQDSNPFSAAAAVHPASLDPEDAPGIKVPFVMLASESEPPSQTDPFKAKLNVPHRIEDFSPQIHGWMAARGDLKDEKVKAAYEKGYKILIEFFGEHL